MVKQTSGELLQGEDLESCAIPEPLNKFLNRGVSVAGIAAREGLTATTESAAKWRRNGLKRLNPGREMVEPRKPGAHYIWYTGARLTVRSDRQKGGGGSGLGELQKKAPRSLKSLHAEMKSAPGPTPASTRRGRPA